MKTETKFVKYPTIGVVFKGNNNTTEYVIFQLSNNVYQMMNYEYGGGWKCHSHSTSMEELCKSNERVFRGTDFLKKTTTYEESDLSGLNIVTTTGTTFRILNCDNKRNCFMMARENTVYTGTYSANEILTYLNNGTWSAVE